MKRIFFFVFLMTIVLITGIFIGCKKSMTTKPKTPIANAGPDSVINMPQTGIPSEFEAILNGKGSHSINSEIVFYSWTAIGKNGSTIIHISSPNTDSTTVIFENPEAGIYQFRLEVMDNLNNIDYDTVSITINRKFLYEYDRISWDSTFNSFTYIDLGPQLTNDGDYQFNLILFGYSLPPDLISFCTFNGNCNDISSWKIIPYLPRDSIELTDKNIFYSTDSSACCINAWYTIYATSNAGIDFSQKISVGVNRSF
jgi:Y_Y_Y domain